MTLKLDKPLFISWIVDRYIGFEPNQFGFLDESKLLKLVGDYYYHNAMIYNYDAGKWNREPGEEYLGYGVIDMSGMNPEIDAMQKRLGREQWTDGLELVAYAAIPIDINNYPGFGKSLSNPVADPTGAAMAGNFIWREQSTRYLYPMNEKWICGDRYDETLDVLCSGLAEFADLMAQHDMFREKLIELVPHSK